MVRSLGRAATRAAKRPGGRWVIVTMVRVAPRSAQPMRARGSGPAPVPAPLHVPRTARPVSWPKFHPADC